MVTVPTTFVLGAGASMAYSFPSGRALANRIADNLQHQNGEMARQCRVASGCEAAAPEEFAREFRASGLYSIDAFLQRRPEFTGLGKAAIAAALIPLEVEQNLFSAPIVDDWYRYLLNHILPPTVEDFTKNLLRVITFNFDRSFERRLFLALKATYRLSAESAAEAAKYVEVIHVHGQLGSPFWSLDAGAPYPRPYDSTATDDTVRACAEQIHLISDELDGTAHIRRARQILATSKKVCFLGFGYHPLNVARLGLADLPASLSLLGTAFEVPTGERNAIKTSFGGVSGNLNLVPADWTIRKLLEEHEMIHA